MKTLEELKQLVTDAHEHGIRLKLYYTTRELTKNLPEFWAFNSLNGELIYPGPGNESRTIINTERSGRMAEKQPAGKLYSRLVSIPSKRVNSRESLIFQ